MSTSNSFFKLAAAHDVTARVHNTWSDLVPRVPRVLVPIQLDVLAVRQEGQQFADCAMAVPDQNTPQPIDTRDLLPPPFRNKDGSRDRGAYLHWALPDALAHGKQALGSDETTFPAIPDRWLVLRIFPSPRGRNAKRTVRGWVLRAGDRAPQEIDLGAWRETGDEPPDEQGRKAEPLTALGYGDAGWSAYFDNVRNRLAFYDSLADVQEGPIAYLVCGWYSKPELDPLSSAHVRSLTDFYARMAEMQWEVPEYQLKQAAERMRKEAEISSMIGLTAKSKVGSPIGPVSFLGGVKATVRVLQDEWWPSQILCHGSVVGIGWPNPGWRGQDDGLLPRENGGPPSASSLRVAVGNTTAEGMAALLVQAGASDDEGRVLEAFQLGLLKELDEPDGRARIDAALHASTFGSMPAGEVEDRVYEPPIQGPSSGGVGVTPKPPHGVFDRNFAQKVKVKVGDGSAITAKESRVIPQSDRGASLFVESRINRGALFDLRENVFAEPVIRPRPGRWVDIKRPQPRFYHPVDPVVLVQGGKRSFRHGGDGRFTRNGLLQCRLSDFTMKEVAIVNGEVRLASGGTRAEYALDRGVDSGSVPSECEDLLRETVILDPGSAEALIRSSRNPASPSPAEAAVARDTRKVMVEQTVWWALRDVNVDPAPIVARSGLAGVLPSPLGVTPPLTPWCPLHLDWRVEFIPSPERESDWKLEEIDYNEVAARVPPAGQEAAGIVVDGRSGLSANVSSILASAVRRSLQETARSGGGGKAPPKNAIIQHHSQLAGRIMTRVAGLRFNTGRDDQEPLKDIAELLDNMDVLNGVLEDFHFKLRGRVAADGQTATSPIPDPFVSVRHGYLRILRLRLVDGFGQFVDLLGSSETTAADASQAVTAPPMVVTGRNDLQALPPRFTGPARLSFRFIKGQPESPADIVEARLATDRTPAVSPICGYLMANHLDSALEYFGQDGLNHGMILPDLEGRIIWEDAPGTPITVGQSPARAIPNPFLAQMAQSVLDWGIADQQTEVLRESVLSALMRVIDTTLWTVDPFGHQGDEHLSLLVGHPIAVMRAQLRLEVLEPTDQETINRIAVPVRLGALTHWQDGLLGYFVNDDYRTFYIPDPASADEARAIGPMDGFLGYANKTQDYFSSFASTPKPVTHPYVNRDGFFLVRPNQSVFLTLLVEPHTRVNATTGLLPRKEIGMQREWIQEALSRLAPTFRFGPVLIDPKRIRMPVATELNGTWSWDHRVDVNVWANDPVTNATQEALLSADPPEGSEGWLRLTPKPPEEESQ
jgi:hypothetical protein